MLCKWCINENWKRFHFIVLEYNPFVTTFSSLYLLLYLIIIVFFANFVCISIAFIFLLKKKPCSIYLFKSIVNCIQWSSLIFDWWFSMDSIICLSINLYLFNESNAIFCHRNNKFLMQTWLNDMTVKQ